MKILAHFLPYIVEFDDKILITLHCDYILLQTLIGSNLEEHFADELYLKPE
jgi:hypothetical protein